MSGRGDIVCEHGMKENAVGHGHREEAFRWTDFLGEIGTYEASLGQLMVLAVKLEWNVELPLFIGLEEPRTEFGGIW